MPKLADIRWEDLKAEAHEVMINLARAGQVVTYSEFCAMLTTAYIHYHSPLLVRLLDEIGSMEAQAGRPVLPALVVAKQTGIPGAGFFRIDSGEAIDDPKAYWQRELKRVFDYWSKA
jgi:hypothetical protein